MNDLRWLDAINNRQENVYQVLIAQGNKTLADYYLELIMLLESTYLSMINSVMSDTDYANFINQYDTFKNEIIKLELLAIPEKV